jgi:hypothetical protein
MFNRIIYPFSCTPQGFQFYAYPVLCISEANVKKKTCQSGITYHKQGSAQPQSQVSSNNVTSLSPNFCCETPWLVHMAVLSRSLILTSVLPMLAICSSSRGKIRPVFIWKLELEWNFCLNNHHTMWRSGGMQIKLDAFLTWAVDWGECLAWRA